MSEETSHLTQHSAGPEAGQGDRRTEEVQDAVQDGSIAKDISMKSLGGGSSVYKKVKDVKVNVCDSESTDDRPGEGNDVSKKLDSLPTDVSTHHKEAKVNENEEFSGQNRNPDDTDTREKKHHAEAVNPESFSKPELKTDADKDSVGPKQDTDNRSVWDTKERKGDAGTSKENENTHNASLPTAASGKAGKPEDNQTDEDKRAAAIAKLRGVKTNDDRDEGPVGGPDLEQRFKAAQEKFTFFWKNKDVFSQWHPSKFTVNHVTFTCAEQYMMYTKAKIFGSDEIAKQILKTNEPRTMKALGRKVRQFKENMWVWHCLNVVKDASIYKYSQNKKMKEELFNTYPTVLVEASPFDRIWGIGLDKTDERAWQEFTWQGHNLLGYILTEVRDELMCRERCIPDKSRRIDKERSKVLIKVYRDPAKIYTPELQEKLKDLHIEHFPGTPIDEYDKQDYSYSPTNCVLY